MPDIIYLFIILNYKENLHEKLYGKILKMHKVVGSLHNIFTSCIAFVLLVR